MPRILKPAALIILVLGGALAALKIQTMLTQKADIAPLARHRDAALAQLKRLQRVAALVEARAPLEADSASLPLSRANFKKHAEPPPDGAFIDASQLTDEMLSRDFSQPHPLTLDDHPFWGRCVAWVLTGRDPNGDAPRFAHVIEEEFGKFLSVKYIGVARAVDYREPTAIEAGTFSGGRNRFDLFLYELADEPRYLGGIRIDAVNSPQVRYQYREKTRTMDQSEWLLRNLRYQTHAALIAALRQRAPGVITHDPEYYQPDLEKQGF
jgi:hypothetical protein